MQKGEDREYIIKTFGYDEETLEMFCRAGLRNNLCSKRLRTAIKPDVKGKKGR